MANTAQDIRKVSFSAMSGFVAAQLTTVTESTASVTTTVDEHSDDIAALQTSQGVQGDLIAVNTQNIATNTSAIAALNAQSGITANVDIQYLETRPLLNSKGLPLREGDLWKKKGQECSEFDGMQWCGMPRYLANAASVVNTAPVVATAGVNVPYSVVSDTPLANIKIISWDVLPIPSTGTLNGDHFWTIESMTRTPSGSDTLLVNGSRVLNNANLGNRYLRLLSNRVLSQVNIAQLVLRCVRSGTPANVFVTQQICYTHVL